MCSVEYFYLTRDADRLELHGELDLGSVASLLHEIASNTTADSLVLDLSGLKFIDARGIAALLRVRRSHPATRIVGVSSRMRSLFCLTGVEALLLDDDLSLRLSPIS